MRSVARDVLLFRWLPAAVLLATLALSPTATAQDEIPPQLENVLMTLDQALGTVLEGGTVEECRVRLGRSDRQRIGKRLKRKIGDIWVPFFRSVDKNGKTTRYALITEEIGKYQPITFIVSASPKGKVERIAVMIYRESHGEEVKRRRFLRQFEGKDVGDRIRVNRDIINISGATLSARAISRGTKKVLAILHDVVLEEEHRRELKWAPRSSEKASAKGTSSEKPKSQPRKSKSANESTASTDANPVRRARYLMGTVLELSLFAESERAERASRAVFEEVSRLESLLSSWRDDSEISAFNRQPVGKPLSVSPDTLACVASAIDWARRTDGVFDPTKKPRGFECVQIDHETGTLTWRDRKHSLDLGGIGKGFALDRARVVLESLGETRALLNFGGQILALDAPPGLDGWPVLVRDPHDPAESAGSYTVTQASVATSGSYERGGHLVDPRHGTVVVTSGSATVLHRSATAADALSTVAVVAPERIEDHLDETAASLLRLGGEEHHESASPGLPTFTPAVRATR